MHRPQRARRLSRYPPRAERRHERFSIRAQTHGRARAPLTVRTRPRAQTAIMSYDREGFMREGSLFKDHTWTVIGQNAVHVKSIFGKDKILKPGECISTGGFFGKPTFVPKQPKLPTPSPHCSPESFVDAAAPTPTKLDLMPGLLPL